MPPPQTVVNPISRNNHKHPVDIFTAVETSAVDTQRLDDMSDRAKHIHEHLVAWNGCSRSKVVVKPLLHHYIEMRRITRLAGLPRSGKSVLTCGISYSVITGSPIFGITPDRTGPVWYISADRDPYEVVNTFQEIVDAHEFILEDYEMRFIIFDDGMNKMNLTSEKQCKALAELILSVPKKERPVLLGVDTVSAVSNGENLAIASNADPFMSNIRLISNATDTAILMLDHTTKPNKDRETTALGATTLSGAFDCEMLLTKKSRKRQTLKWENHRDSGEINLSIDWDEYEWSVAGESQGDLTSTQQDVLHTLEKHPDIADDASKKKDFYVDVGEEVGKSWYTVRDTILELHKMGLVVDRGEGFVLSSE